jgi:hypothetical protein
MSGIRSAAVDYYHIRADNTLQGTAATLITTIE